MRLDRFVSRSSGLSRSEVRRLLRRGAVSVDGSVVTAVGTAVDGSSRVELEGRPLAVPGFRYFMLNKPAGVVSATEDARHPTVLALLDEPHRDLLHPVGRLDIDTTGLVLLSDDGRWSHGITAPRRHQGKRYRVALAESLTDEAAARFRSGLLLRGETRPTLPAELEAESPTVVRVILREGRYHQVKRMFAALGNHVTALHREAIGGVVLDSELEPGQYRALSANEIEVLR